MRRACTATERAQHCSIAALALCIGHRCALNLQEKKAEDAERNQKAMAEEREAEREREAARDAAVAAERERAIVAEVQREAAEAERADAEEAELEVQRKREKVSGPSQCIAPILWQWENEDSTGFGLCSRGFCC